MEKRLNQFSFLAWTIFPLKTKSSGHYDLNLAQSNKLLDELKRVRQQIADEHSCLPRAILNDRHLRYISLNPPQNLTDFEKIPNLTSSKTEKYGEIFIRAIRVFCTTNSQSNKL